MKYSFDSRIRFSEVDEKGYLSLPSLINYLIDCATFHGEEAGVGLDWIAENKMTWVMSSFRLGIRRYPKFGTTIRVSTWATGFRGFLGYRDFLIESDSGDVIAAGKSDWVFMNMRENKPMNVPAPHANAYGIEKDSALPESFGRRKIRLPDDCTAADPFVIHESNLDTNGHVNSGQYVLLAQNYLPVGFSPDAVRAEYKRQAYLGDVVTPVVYPVADGVAVELRNAAGETYFTGEFTKNKHI